MDVSTEEINVILKSTGLATDVTKIDEISSLRKAGLDSLDMMNVLLALEEKYGVKIPDEDVDKIDSIASIRNYLRNL